jgi:hypothetical protein
VYRLVASGRVSPPAFRELDPASDLRILVEHLRDPIGSIRVGNGPAVQAGKFAEAEKIADEALKLVGGKVK